MIVVDASAALAILLGEPEADSFASILFEAGGSLISPVNLWEVLVRADALYPENGRKAVESQLQSLKVHVPALTSDHSWLAADAFRRFGKRSSAGLNLGDCFAYALAASEGDGLLYKGNDFPKTDIKSVA